VPLLRLDGKVCHVGTSDIPCFHLLVAYVVFWLFWGFGGWMGCWMPDDTVFLRVWYGGMGGLK